MIKFLLLITSFLISYLFSLTKFQFSIDRKIEIDTVATLRIAVVGDLMCHSPQFNYAKVSKDSFDFNPVYRYIKESLENADFTVGNLETVIGKKGSVYLGYPRFRSPKDYVTALANNGFDLLFFANNHTLDQREIGVLNTIQTFNENDIGYTGAFISRSDRDSVRIFNLKGINIALLAYSYGTNGSVIPKGKHYLINLIDYNLVEKDILSAKRGGAEIVLVNFHFGNEYQRFPSDYQKEVVRKTIEFGADLITASHPHVIQPLEFYKTNGATLDSGIVAYSLGNFISNQRKRFTDAGVILYFNLEKNINTKIIKLKSVEYIPTWVFKGKTDFRNEFLILPLSKGFDSLNFLSDSDRAKMKQALNDTKEIITTYTKNVQLSE